MEWNKFLGLVKANLGVRIETAAEAEEWKNFADQADEVLLREAVAPLMERYAEALNNREPTKTPVLAQIKVLYNKYKQEKIEAAHISNAEFCETCRNRGVVWVLWDDSKKRAINIRQPFYWWRGMSFDKRLAPCNCAVGRHNAPHASPATLKNNAFCGFAWDDEDKFNRMLRINVRFEEE